MSSNTKVFDPISIGRRIKFARKKSGLSARALGEQSFLDEASIYNVERGRNSPSSYSLFAIALALGITTDWILGLTEDLPDKLAD